MTARSRLRIGHPKIGRCVRCRRYIRFGTSYVAPAEYEGRRGIAHRWCPEIVAR